MELIKQYQTKEYVEAKAWGLSHPEQMKLADNPYDFFDRPEFDLWSKAKYVRKLDAMTADQQLQQYNADQFIGQKILS